MLWLIAAGIPVAAADDAAQVIYQHKDKYGDVVFTDKEFHSGRSGKSLHKTWKGWVERDSSLQKPRRNSSGRRAAYDWKRNQQHYDHHIRALGSRYGVSHILIHAVITAESAYNPEAISSAGAVGLMQLMPGTAKRYGVVDRTDPYENMRAGVNYLSDLLHLFDNDVNLALAAYNAGENAVQRYGNRIPPYRNLLCARFSISKKLSMAAG
ncbi:MAG: lytic transglycosylase domain-containing protein [Candidatus Eutrophobiaceae bacterium]